MKPDDIKRHGTLGNMGAAQFEVVCEPTEVRLVIHGSHVVAKTQEDVYEKLFDYCKAVIEGSSL